MQKIDRLDDIGTREKDPIVQGGFSSNTDGELVAHLGKFKDCLFDSET